MREVRVPQRDLFNGAVQRTRVCQLIAHPTGHLSNDAASIALTGVLKER
jgi:hypothetical protein